MKNPNEFLFSRPPINEIVENISMSSIYASFDNPFDTIVRNGSFLQEDTHKMSSAEMNKIIDMNQSSFLPGKPNSSDAIPGRIAHHHHQHIETLATHRKSSMLTKMASNDVFIEPALPSNARTSQSSANKENTQNSSLRRSSRLSMRLNTNDSNPTVLSTNTTMNSANLIHVRRSTRLSIRPDYYESQRQPQDITMQKSNDQISRKKSVAKPKQMTIEQGN